MDDACPRRFLAAIAAALGWLVAAIVVAVVAPWGAVSALYVLAVWGGAPMAAVVVAVAVIAVHDRWVGLRARAPRVAAGPMRHA
jgi:hypothetical protein